MKVKAFIKANSTIQKRINAAGYKQSIKQFDFNL